MTNIELIKAARDLCLRDEPIYCDRAHWLASALADALEQAMYTIDKHDELLRNLSKILQTQNEKLYKVQPKRKAGRWIKDRECCCEYKCSVCSYNHCRENDFCPNCGAKMTEV